MSEQNSIALESDVDRDDPVAHAAAQQARAAEIQRQAIEAGAMLRQLRESAGVDAMLLATTLKVTLQKIEALENGRLEDLPDMTFARGLAAAVCRAFDVDPDPVLALMPVVARGLQMQMQMQPAETTTLGEPPPLRQQRLPPPVTFTTGGGDKNALLRWFSEIPRWLSIVVSVLLVGALVVWLLPDWRLRSNNLPEISASEASPAMPASNVASVAAGTASDAASAVMFGTAPATDAASAPTSGAGGAPSQAASTPAATAVPNTPVAPATPLTANPAPVVPPTTTAAAKPDVSTAPAPQPPAVTAVEVQEATAAALRAEAASAERAAAAASRAEAAASARTAAAASRAAAAAAARASAASADQADRALAAARASAARAALAAQRGSSGSDAAASSAQPAGSAPKATQRGSGVTEANVVTFNASGPVWVNVSDGEGKTVFAHVLNGGETTSVGGLLPLTVTVGDRSSVSVKVRGGPVDLDRYSRSGGTVAKFTVEPRRPAQ